MSSSSAINFSSIHLKVQHLSLGTLCKSIAISGLVLFLFYSAFFYNHHYEKSSKLFMPFFEHKWTASPDITNSPTNITHIKFVVLGSLSTWEHRKQYIEAWWRENVTRGNLWLDGSPTGKLLPWSSSSPPFRVNEDVTKIYRYLKSPVQVRMYHSILETFRLGDDKDVRWYVMADDDTLIFIDNLVEMLGKYDHTKLYYIGTNSEGIKSNSGLSFDMAYGGAGYALSYSLVEALASHMDRCIEKYQHLFFSDYISQSCCADLGVDLTIEKGIHQIDLRGDISGLLSAHPNSPLITLHHFDAIDPIFPHLRNRFESINHLMKAAKVDQSRLLQQTICYHRQSHWTFSISWGYSVHIYESLLPRSFLRKPLETFKPWLVTKPPFFMFNTRWLTNDPCEAPHVFFSETIRNSTEGDQVVTTYTRRSHRNLSPCSLNSNHSADPVTKIQVFSLATGRKEARRIECCDVEYIASTDTADVKLRACMKDEILLA